MKKLLTLFQIFMAVIIISSWVLMYYSGHLSTSGQYFVISMMTGCGIGAIAAIQLTKR